MVHLFIGLLMLEFVNIYLIFTTVLWHYMNTDDRVNIGLAWGIGFILIGNWKLGLYVIALSVVRYIYITNVWYGGWNNNKERHFF